jgi:hypothetical protein
MIILRIVVFKIFLYYYVSLQWFSFLYKQIYLVNYEKLGVILF